jgi:phosphatidylserine/phosphatidylglycerophosphate/cardiolipin synthase-like enzyme
MVEEIQREALVEPPFKTDKTQTHDSLHAADFMSMPASMDSRSEGQTNNTGDAQLPNVILLKGQANPADAQKQVDQVSNDLINYIDGAKKSLDIALYHFDLTGNDGANVVAALNKKAEEGVNIRLAVYEPEGKASEPVNSAGLQMNFDNSAFDKNIQVEGIKGAKLMHDKYMVRDADSDSANVWTGSTNFTDEAFGSQENNIVQLPSRDIANDYEQDFSEMWDKQSFAGTGIINGGSANELPAPVQVGASDVTVGFSPGDGAVISSEIASQIENAQHSVHIASMDISSEPVLKALADKINSPGVTVDGIYDGPEMQNVVGDWQRAIAKTGSQSSQEKLDLWNEISPHLVAKHSNPHGEGIANIMHDKVVETDDTSVTTGSFNFSDSAEQNAENAVKIDNPKIASEYGAYIDNLVQAYGQQDKQSA